MGLSAGDPPMSPLSVLNTVEMPGIVRRQRAAIEKDAGTSARDCTCRIRRAPGLRFQATVQRRVLETPVRAGLRAGLKSRPCSIVNWRCRDLRDFARPL